MKKQYTKKQITEAISYWEKQLANGNYRKVNESALANVVVVPAMDKSSQTAFEEQLNGMFGGDAYESLLDSDREEYYIDGYRYAVSPQDLVDKDYFLEFIYDRLNEDFDPGQEVAAD